MTEFTGDFAAIPELTKAGLARYVDHHCQPGSFLSAVISGNLFEAIRRADLSNRQNIGLIAMWLEMNHPGLCGPENFREHLARRNT